MTDFIEEELMNIAKRNGGKQPLAKWLVSRHGLSEPEARECIKNFRNKHYKILQELRESETIAGQSLPSEVTSNTNLESFHPLPNQESQTITPGPSVAAVSSKTGWQKFMAWLGTLLEKATDNGSLGWAIVLDLFLNGVGFFIIGPDELGGIMKIAMVSLSFIIVLFSLRAWIKQDILLWAIFATVATFMDVSFVLAATDVQDRVAGVDTELVSRKAQVEKDSKYLEELQSKQLEKGAGYAQQINDAREALSSSREYLEIWQNKPKELKMSEHMTAKSVATAIPDAIMSGKMDRYILLAVFFLSFFGLQLTIISASGVKYGHKKSSS